MPASKAKKTFKVTQLRSSSGCNPTQRACLKGLGLKRIGHTVEREDTPAVRGMARKIHFLVRVEESS